MITVNELNTNYSEIPTGEIEMTLDEFVRKYHLIRNANGTFSAEWGGGQGEDTFEIITHLNSIAEPLYEITTDLIAADNSDSVTFDQIAEIVRDWNDANWSYRAEKSGAEIIAFATARHEDVYGSPSPFTNWQRCGDDYYIVVARQQ